VFRVLILQFQFLNLADLNPAKNYFNLPQIELLTYFIRNQLTCQENLRINFPSLLSTLRQ